MIRMMTITLPVISRPKILKIGNPVAKETRADDQQEQAGDDQHGFGEAHQEAVHPAAIIGRHRADQRADEHFHERGGNADQHGDLPAINGAGQNIPADDIRAEGMFSERAAATFRLVSLQFAQASPRTSLSIGAQ